MTNEQTIWTTLRGAGLTEAGTAGLMGNLKAESALIPTNLQNTYERKLGYTDATYTAAVDNGSYTGFSKDGAGYGLAQWTYHTRKAALLSFARAQGKSIGDPGMQLDFLVKELKSDYPAVWKMLTTTGSVRAASDAVLLQFERPADISEKMRALRAGFGQTFLRKLGGTTVQETSPVTPPCPTAKTISGTIVIDGVTYRISGEAVS